MEWDDYVAERLAKDPEFRAYWEETRAQFEFRKALVRARIDAGLTQREMAERLGVKQSAVARWEAGQTMPTLESLFRVAKSFDLDFAITPDAPLVVTPHRAVEAAGGSLREEAEDLQAFEDRAHDTLLSYDEMVSRAGVTPV
jgi:transcriptional regulator with XRE-family HTH domain